MSNDIEDIEVFFDKSDGCYLESLIKSRVNIEKASNISQDIIYGLEEVILLELELAKMGAEKAKSEIIKAAAKEKDNVRPIK